jgi:hypothetical protein
LVAALAVTVINPGLSLAAGDQIEAYETRSLARLLGQLWNRQNFPITCEEGPYDPANEVFTALHPNGKHFRYPASKPMTFDGIPHKNENAETSLPEQHAAAEYNSSGEEHRGAGRTKRRRLKNDRPRHGLIVLFRTIYKRQS